MILKHEDRKHNAVCLGNRKQKKKNGLQQELVFLAKLSEGNEGIKEMGFTFRKTLKRKITKLQWAKDKQSWTVDVQISVI